MYNGLMVTMRVAWGALGLSVVLLGGALYGRRQPPVLSEAQMAQFAEADDPTIGTVAPTPLRDDLNAASTLVVYLPDCGSCTIQESLPNGFNPAIGSLIFVKRTATDIPLVVGKHHFLLDKDGEIQRALNGFKAPRFYRFEGQRLTAIQGLGEMWSDFMTRQKIRY